MSRHVWTDEQIMLLAALYPHTKTGTVAIQLGLTTAQVWRKAANMGLKKSKQYLATPDACRLRQGGDVGTDTRFKPGHQTWNKGRKGVSYPGCKATQFKKGNRSGAAAKNWKPIGHERVLDGYLQRKVTDTGYTPRDYRAVHALLWEEQHGPIPVGHIVVFKDKDRKNITIENLELISRGELMRRNTLHRYPKSITRAIQLRAALNRKINARSKTNGQ